MYIFRYCKILRIIKIIKKGGCGCRAQHGGCTPYSLRTYNGCGVFKQNASQKSDACRQMSSRCPMLADKCPKAKAHDKSIQLPIYL